MLDFRINRMQLFKVFDGGGLCLRVFLAGISILLVINVNVKAIDVHSNQDGS